LEQSDGLPAADDLGGQSVEIITAVGGSARGPQPDRLGLAVTGQVLDLQADERAFHDP